MLASFPYPLPPTNMDRLAAIQVAKVAILISQQPRAAVTVSATWKANSAQHLALVLEAAVWDLPHSASRQEHITTTKKGLFTSVQAVYVPADDLTDPAPATSCAHLETITIPSRSLAELGIYLVLDPLDSKS